MFVDVSEVKSFRECKRKWAFSSRNKWHLRSKAPKSALAFGTLFHEGLHSLYLSGNLERTLETTLKELSDPAEQRTMEAMLTGYAENVLCNDLAEFAVLDIEHKFYLNIPPFDALGITLAGSIDMIAVNQKTNEVWGFEHKSCGRFRDPLYTAVDEQPRLYTVALKEYVHNLNEHWAQTHPDEPEHFTLGGIYINEVRKVQRSFDHKRTPCVYSQRDLENFMNGFYISCEGIVDNAQSEIADPEPGYMKCNMCDFKELCSSYKYTVPNLDDVLDEFSEEFEVRDVDHLEEKLEREGVTF